MKIGILASGNLGAICLNKCLNNLNPLFIATDSNSTAIIDIATKNNIPLFKGNPRNGKLATFLSTNTFDIILSINYLFILEEDVISKATYPINFHGSLLPKYRGRTPHVWAIINNEKITGVTAHIIDNGCDTGDIVLQEKIEIEEEETGANILAKYENIYPIMIDKVLKMFAQKKFVTTAQDNTKATYFGKRTPTDGAINWNWQKEQIKNWVRAQAFPYPGAFGYINEEKAIIDQIAFCEYGFIDTDPNGLVLSTTPNIVVKTPNGAVELTTVRSNINTITKGQIFV